MLTLDTRKILCRSCVRPAHKFINKRLPKGDDPKTGGNPDESTPKEAARGDDDGPPTPTKPTVKEYLKSKRSDDDPMPSINVKDLIGRVYLKEYEDTGERHRAEILEIYMTSSLKKPRTTLTWYE